MPIHEQTSARIDREEGLAPTSAWTPAISEAQARAAGLSLGPRHWQAICAAREAYASAGRSPSLATIAELARLELEDLRALFPPAPELILPRLAGLARCDEPPVNEPRLDERRGVASRARAASCACAARRPGKP
jgi:sulfur relay (sulfurtransferase) DsrC/TusE family protein